MLRPGEVLELLRAQRLLSCDQQRNHRYRCACSTWHGRSLGIAFAHAGAQNRHRRVLLRWLETVQA